MSEFGSDNKFAGVVSEFAMECDRFVSTAEVSVLRGNLSERV